MGRPCVDWIFISIPSSFRRKLWNRKLTDQSWERKYYRYVPHSKLFCLIISTCYNEQSQRSCFCLEGEGGSAEAGSCVYCRLHLCVCDVYAVDVHLDAQIWNGWNNAAVQASGYSGEGGWGMLRFRRVLRGRWVLLFCFYLLTLFVCCFTNKFY